MQNDVVIAIDGGGTYTRTIAADFKGNILSCALGEGSHPQKNINAKKNVQDSINEVIAKAGISMKSIKLIAGGFAGLNTDSDLIWAKQLTNIDGLGCECLLVNDAVIAQKGAFLGGSGIICIAGTGSSALGLNECGSIIRTFDFQYKPNAAARYFTNEALFYLITKKINKELRSFTNGVFEYWNVKSMAELSTSVYQCLSHTNPDTTQRLSQMSPLVISHAEKGNAELETICSKVLNSLCLGAVLVSSRFSRDTIPISLTGGVFKSPYIRKLMHNQLENNNWVKKYYIVEPKASPIIGAVLIAYEQLGIKLDKLLLDKMIDSEKKLHLY